MKILKASAGSGKTYRLANAYIDLLLDSPDRYAYRHILAVTFTNKATAEMKSRILDILSEKAAVNEKAAHILRDILHDYSAFSVCTIDKFFQQALKAFAREIGQFASYQIELDRKSLIAETTDRMLDSLSPDNKVTLAWIRETMEESLSKGKKLNLDTKFQDTGARLKSEEFRSLCEELKLKDTEIFTKEKLGKLKSTCLDIMTRFEAEADALGAKRDRSGQLKQQTAAFFKKHPEVEALFESGYALYNTARRIYSGLFYLGFAGEFFKEFDILLKEKNIMCLDESNKILRDIIDGSDAPFVYEKLGIRYENFLLDEFQDTSCIQWENFVPLLKESESKGGKNLIVGDVKQSIYRWRNSDWRLLDSEVEKTFPGQKPETMEDNWRSCRTIVDFNNAFFEYASRMLGEQGIYSDVRQNVRTKDTAQSGQVRISYSDDVPQAVLDSVLAAVAQGADYADIAILTRGHKEGATIAGKLIDNGIPVVSDDSLRVKASITVRRLASLLNYIDDPEDRLGSFLAGSLNISFPETYHSLTDQAEAILRALRQFDPESYGKETLFIQAFMDDLHDWTGRYGNNLHYFLSHWNENDPYISSPEGTPSVRIITIHKSKGLQFPYVIIPFIENIKFYFSETKWCALDPGATALDADGSIYPVSLDSDCDSSYFRKSFEQERRMQAVDNLNILYVAFTRAEKTLHVISSSLSKEALDRNDGNVSEMKSFSELIYRYIGKYTEYSEGKAYDFSIRRKEEKAGVPAILCDYTSIPLGARLVPSEEASEFFGEDGSVGTEASARLNGIVLHGILSKVGSAGELGGAVSEAVTSGLLTASQGEVAEKMLAGRIASHSEWFAEKLDIRNESSVIGPDGKEYRPDRVVIEGKRLTIIDYKFGEKSAAYEKQVRKYMDLYRQLGWEDVNGAVWYVPENIVDTIGNNW